MAILLTEKVVNENINGLWHWRIISEDYEITSRWLGNDLVWYTFVMDKDTKIAHIKRQVRKNLLPSYIKMVERINSSDAPFVSSRKRKTKARNATSTQTKQVDKQDTLSSFL